MEVTEGGVTVRVPEQPDAGVGDVVFYNPRQELNRDVTVAALRAYRERAGLDAADDGPSYLDATAASGIRGVRAGVDGWTVTCCDRDSDAAALARANLARHGLLVTTGDTAGTDTTPDGTADSSGGDRPTVAPATVVERDANAYMHEHRFGFDVVDVDPFGTPMPLADAAVRAARGMVCVTATDTAPLCGAHFRSGVRTYSAVPRNTEYHAEMGVRVLLGALARTAARYDRGVTPLLTHASDHYVRTYLALDSSATAADAAVDALGTLHHCPDCLFRTTTRGLVAAGPSTCPNCGTTPVTAGPLWLGPTRDRSFVARTRTHLDADMATADRARDLLERIETELDTPTHYDQHELCERWGEPATAMADFLAALRDAGHDASRTHYGGTTFKTDADVTAIHAVRPDPSG